MALPFLETIGLTKKESEIYELLLQKGQIPVGIIIQALQLKRATAYKSIASLEQKGLVTKQDIHKILHVRPESPEKLMDLSESQLKAQERARQDLRSILPDLASSFVMAVEKPVISIYEGVKGIKEVYEDTLKEGKPIYAALLPSDMDPDVLKYLRNSYRVRRAKMGIHAHVLAASNKFAVEYKQLDKKYERTTIVIPGDKFPFQHEIDIYGNKVAFIHYTRNQPLIGVIINHPQIARTMKALWDIAWEGADSLYARK